VGWKPGGRGFHRARDWLYYLTRLRDQGAAARVSVRLVEYSVPVSRKWQTGLIYD